MKREIIKIDCRGKELVLGEKTLIMGILNVTPDSFSDGGKFNALEKSVEHAVEMVADDADIIDIGGESTRPGHEVISDEEELSRIVPAIKAVSEAVSAPISIDTYKAGVAAGALEAGAHIINDIWGFQREPEIAKVVARYNAPAIIMHNQDGTEYDMDIIESMKEFFKKSLEIAFDAGVKKENIILDPGIGFGKNVEQNIEVMSRLEELLTLGYPVLLGTSRKSMIGKILDLPSDQRIEGTVATTVIGVQKGMDIVRVHDVKENFRAAKVADAIYRGYRG